MSKLEIMNIDGVDCYEQDGTAYLKLEAVARGLGFTTTQHVNGREYTNIRWNRVDGYLKEMGFATSGKRAEFIPENIFYRLAMKAKNEVAEKFQAKVADEIIPSIRRHGLYAVDELLNDPDLAIKAFTALKEEREKNKRLAADNERMKPKEIFHDAVAGSKSSIPIGDLAKILKQNGIDIGANRMFKWMRENGFLIKRKGRDWNIPTQKSMNAGLFEVKECTIPAPPYVGRTSLVTGFGQTYFIKKFLGESNSAATTSGTLMLN